MVCSDGGARNAARGVVTNLGEVSEILCDFCDVTTLTLFVQYLIRLTHVGEPHRKCSLLN